jgi:hypothetical protein
VPYNPKTYRQRHATHTHTHTLSLSLSQTFGTCVVDIWQMHTCVCVRMCLLYVHATYIHVHVYLMHMYKMYVHVLTPAHPRTRTQTHTHTHYQTQYDDVLGFLLESAPNLLPPSPVGVKLPEADPAPCSTCPPPPPLWYNYPSEFPYYVSVTHLLSLSIPAAPLQGPNPHPMYRCGSAVGSATRRLGTWRLQSINEQTTEVY